MTTKNIKKNASKDIHKIIKKKANTSAEKINHILGFIAADHAGYELKEFLKSKFPLIDLGTFSDKSVDYPDYAKKLSRYVLKEKTYGILICGTGIGMSIAANRNKGINAAVCYNTQAAEISREHNNANVLILGGRVTSQTMAVKIVKKFFDTEFSKESRHIRRVKKLDM
jgi:RpiB/LacA/LacB family sugar-phosphate isomerase